jgi:hypothetical protein
MAEIQKDLKGEVVDVEDEKHAQMLQRSQAATNLEHSLGVFEAIKLYPYAVLWASLFAWSLVRPSQHRLLCKR